VRINLEELPGTGLSDRMSLSIPARRPSRPSGESIKKANFEYDEPV
jgi:hypothetical protein